MEVTVRYFAVHRDAVGRSEESLEVPEGTSVGQLMEMLARRHPALVGLRRDTLVSVNRGLGGEDIVLSEGDDVVLYPPITGG